MGDKCFYEIDEKGIALLKINNPPMNALDEQTMREFEVSLKELAENSEAKVIILTGEGPTFIVGADVNKVKEIETKEEGESLDGFDNQTLQNLSTLLAAHVEDKLDRVVH